MLKKPSINHNALPYFSSLPWRIWNCSSSQNTAMRSACVLWLGKLGIECLRNSLEISQQSNGRNATSPFFNKLAHHLSFERKWENLCVTLPCTAMTKQSVFKVLNEEAPGFVFGKRWQQCQQAEPEPSGPSAAGDRAQLALPRHLWYPKGCQWPSTLFSSSPALQGHMETDSCVVPLDLHPPSLHAAQLEHGDLNLLMFMVCLQDPLPLCLPHLKPLWPSAGERAALGCGRHHEGPAGNSKASAGAALVCAGPCVCNLYYDCAMWYPWCAYALLPEMLS